MNHASMVISNFLLAIARGRDDLFQRLRYRGWRQMAASNAVEPVMTLAQLDDVEQRAWAVDGLTPHHFDKGRRENEKRTKSFNPSLPIDELVFFSLPSPNLGTGLARHDDDDSHTHVHRICGDSVSDHMHSTLKRGEIRRSRRKRLDLHQPLISVDLLW